MFLNNYLKIKFLPKRNFKLCEQIMLPYLCQCNNYQHIICTRIDKLQLRNKCIRY